MNWGTHQTIYSTDMIKRQLDRYVNETPLVNEYDTGNAARQVVDALAETLPPGWRLDHDGVLIFPVDQSGRLGHTLTQLSHVYEDDENGPGVDVPGILERSAQ